MSKHGLFAGGEEHIFLSDGRKFVFGQKFKPLLLGGKHYGSCFSENIEPPKK
jgi:hypothetical protein